MLKLNLSFSHIFIEADIHHPILGADFLLIAVSVASNLCIIVPIHETLTMVSQSHKFDT